MAGTPETPAAPSRRNRYQRALAGLESAEALDPAVDLANPLAEWLRAAPGINRVVDGRGTGVPAHVILTDLPLGAWFMAQYLDLFGDEHSRVAARRLVGLGLVGAVPTALTGWGRWAGAPRETRRAGVVHAAANGVAATLFLASWAARSRGHDRAGVALARTGSIPLLAGAMLGGHVGRRSPLPR